jgi:hypothetical protein
LQFGYPGNGRYQVPETGARDQFVESPPGRPQVRDFFMHGLVTDHSVLVDGEFFVEGWKIRGKLTAESRGEEIIDPNVTKWLGLPKLPSQLGSSVYNFLVDQLS